MTATLHLHSISDAVTAPDAPPSAVYLVIQRSNGHWSPAAKIISVHETESVAEAIASTLRTKQPQQAFGIFKLRSEARPVAVPIEIVRASDGDA